LMVVAMLLISAVTVVGSSAAATKQALQITTSPALFPAFDPGITDYVVRCTGTSPVQVSVNPTPGTKVTVDGGPPIKKATTVAVNLAPSQAFSFNVNPPGNSSTNYYVRCLPTDFPTFSVSRPGTPQAEYYVLNSAS